MNQRLPIMSCCILTYNNTELLYDTLNSVFMQDYPYIELIVSDDGSKDFQKKPVERYISLNKGENIVSFTVLDHKTNQGTVHNYNTAISASSGDYICPVSCGDLLYSEHVISEVVKRFLDTNWSVVAFRRLLVDEYDLQPIRLMPSDDDLDAIAMLSDSKSQFKAFSGASPYYEMASGSCTCYKKSLLENYDLFDEDYRLWEDGTFYTRYTRSGGVIHTAYDIIYIKYRYGGITTKKDKTSLTYNQLKRDSATMIRKEVLPYYHSFTLAERRKIDCRLYCDEHYMSSKFKLGLIVLLKWPEQFLQRFINYIASY